MKNLRLCIELVPKTAWGGNLRQVLKRGDWDDLRKETYHRHNYRCTYCGDNRKLHCHEQWSYNIDTRTQRLLDLVAICPMCHHVKHIGLAERLAFEKKLNLQNVVEHFCEVNECDTETFYEHRRQSFREWVLRSKVQWKTEVIWLDGEIIPTNREKGK